MGSIVGNRGRTARATTRATARATTRATVLAAALVTACLLAGCMNGHGNGAEDAPPQGQIVPPGATAPLPPADPVDDCEASGVQDLIGKDRAAISGMRFAHPLRVIEHGQPVTMDFNPQRLNIQLARSGKITAITCG